MLDGSIGRTAAPECVMSSSVMTSSFSSSLSSSGSSLASAGWRARPLPGWRRRSTRLTALRKDAGRTVASSRSDGPFNTGSLDQPMEAGMRRDGARDRPASVGAWHTVDPLPVVSSVVGCAEWTSTIWFKVSYRKRHAYANGGKAENDAQILREYSQFEGPLQ